MFCSGCGKEFYSDVKFCQYCGFNIAEGRVTAEKTTEKEEPNTVLFSIKPTFVGVLSLIEVLPIQLFSTLWGALFFGGFSSEFLFKGYGALPFILFGCLFFLGTPVVIFIWTKMTYERSLYTFYNSRLEYTESFLVKELKTIQYKRILEVYLKKGIVQNMFGLGTIILSTAATGGFAGSGILIQNVKNPDQAYKKIKEIIEKHQ